MIETEVTCWIDNEQVDCKTWGDPLPKEEEVSEEIDSQTESNHE